MLTSAPAPSVTPTSPPSAATVGAYAPTQPPFGAVELPIGSLEVFWLDAYGGGVFLPFRDLTSGKTTYGGGRYLVDTVKGTDGGCLEVTPGSTDVTIDFNYAYHPSCVYSPRWACPLAPPENRLPVPVRAGERL